jgi:S-formylglutathione hydrolase FrmB
MPKDEPAAKGWWLCYALHGYGGDRFSWVYVLDEMPQIYRNSCIWIFPESGRRWFINDASGCNYEDYFLGDLMPAVDSAYDVKGYTRGIIIGGFSMGGAAAIQIALRHQKTFCSAFSLSGAFYAHQRTGDPYAKFRNQNCLMPTEEEHNRVWGLPGSNVREYYDNDLIVECAAAEGINIDIYLEVGSDDYSRVVEQNRRLHKALLRNGIAHSYSEQPGHHDWEYVKSGAVRVIKQLISR